MKYKLIRFFDIFRYDIPDFLRNLYVFRKALWSYRRWDWIGMVRFMEESARDMAECHEKHGHLVRSKDTAKELKVLAELLKRIREDDYLTDKGYYRHTGKGIFDFKFVQKENQLPKEGTKSFYKIVGKQQQNELKMACNLMARKLLTWWD